MNLILKYGWYFLLFAIVGEMLTPFIFGLFYKGYDHSTMTISSLGNVDSPIRIVFNIWMLTAGILFLLSIPNLYITYKDTSKPLTLTVVLFVAIFAIGACIFTCFFSVNESKDIVTTASKIHGVGSVIGFMLLLFVPLMLSILSFKKSDNTTGFIAILSFVLTMIFFILFIMSDKAEFQNSVIAKEGLWQRLNLLFMYMPLGFIAIKHIIAK